MKNKLAQKANNSEPNQETNTISDGKGEYLFEMQVGIYHPNTTLSTMGE